MVKILKIYCRNLFLLILGIILYNTNIYGQFWKDDKLSLIKSTVNSDLLRIDGYYYREVNSKYYSIYFFYNDGTLLYGGGGLTFQELIELEARFTTDIWLNSVRKYKDFWGLFTIEGNKIEFEHWYSSSGGPYPAYIRSGEILNDTTFRITQSMRSNGKEVNEKNEVYHFKQFGPKPDSTNNFIK